jgi:hypothetical protein
MVVKDDPTNLMLNPNIFVEGFTDYFDDVGTYLGEPKQLDLFNLGQDNQCLYSRRSLMTFVMVEILQQALSYINSSKFRDMHGQIDCRRYLRNIIVTCPTAMPLQEQRMHHTSARILRVCIQTSTITGQDGMIRQTDVHIGAYQILQQPLNILTMML